MNSIGSETRFVYDDRSLLLTRTDALSNPSEFSYYDNGRLHAWTDRNHETTTYVFTPLGKLESATYPDSSAVSFIYNSQGRMSQMNDSLGQTTFGYDAAGRLTTLTDAHGFTVGYEYDAAGNVAAIIYPGGKTVSYTYDALNRLKSATIEWLGRTAIYHYDAAGRLYGVDRFNASYTGYGHDDANRLTSVSHSRSDNSVIASFDFTLDDNGNRVHESRQAPLKTILTTSALEYGYNDFRNRLETAGEVSFDYDLEGQLSSKNEAVYAFDYEHRLTDVSGTTQYSYDGLGRRLAACRNGITTRYVYDASGNLLAEADENNAIVRYYIYGCGLLAMATASNELYSYHFDGTGNTIAMTDASQTIVNSYAYTPFGIIVNARETIPQPFKYVGEYGVMAEPNGLCYMRNRYYDPEVGRFISEDPIGFDGGDVNLYAYAQNNPVNMIDPHGLATITVGGTFRFPGWLVRTMNWAYEKVTGERLCDSELTPRGISAGGAISFPWLWGGGEWDAGAYYTTPIGGVDIGFGRGTLDLGFNKGSVKDLACREDVEISAHYIMHGGSLIMDGNNNSITGVNYHFGAGLNGGIVGAPTSVYSIRHGIK